jgi:sulfur carrier protein
MPSAMQITVNGEPRELAQPMPLRRVLEGLALPALERGVAVAVNGELVRRGEWEQRIIQPQDELEVVQAAQGG